MSDLAWCRRVADFCKSHGVVFTDTIAAMAKTQAYHTARIKFAKGAGWEEVHEFLTYALKEVRRTRNGKKKTKRHGVPGEPGVQGRPQGARGQ